MLVKKKRTRRHRRRRRRRRRCRRCPDSGVSHYFEILAAVVTYTTGRFRDRQPLPPPPSSSHGAVVVVVVVGGGGVRPLALSIRERGAGYP